MEYPLAAASFCGMRLLDTGAAELYYETTGRKRNEQEGERMKSDQDQPGKPPRRTHSAPVPGMPYGLHTEKKSESSADARRAFEFIEVKPMSEQREAPVGAFNSWEEQGWEGGDAAFSVTREPEEPPEEQYFSPMPDLEPEDPYQEMEETGVYADGEPYGEPYEEPYPQPYPQAYPEPYPEPTEDGSDEPPDAQEPAPPPPVQERRPEPWRAAVILSCIAGLLFCGVEIYRIAQNIVQSQAEFSAYREVYLVENNEDFSGDAQAVALLPAGVTYPPTASPVPVSTPTPTPRIALNDPLVAAMSEGGVDPDQSVSPVTPTPAARTAITRYPDNPLLVLRSDIETLQEENGDIVGRLTIGGILNELVVQQNNTYYLNHNATGAYSGYGAVFVDENVNFRIPPENILLYGRTSNEGKTFAPLKNYVSQGIEFAGRYAFLSFNTLYEEARYVVIAVIDADSSPSSPQYFNYKRLSFDTDADMLQFAQEAISRSLYIFNVGVIPSDRLLTLATLSDGTDSDSIVIVCRMLREGESDGYIQAN